MKSLFCIIVLVLAFPTNILAHGDENEKEYKPAAKAFIVSPKDGAKVSRTFKVQFGLMGMNVSPAGIAKKNSGHHHLLIDGKKLPNLNAPLGAEVTHFGGGQTETEVTLEPGKHTLQLILGDHLHRPHTPPVVSKKITVIVE